MNADTVVRARIDRDTKTHATEALQAMGLSVSDAIRLLLLRVADEKRLPFAALVPLQPALRPSWWRLVFGGKGRVGTEDRGTRDERVVRVDFNHRRLHRSRTMVWLSICESQSGPRFQRI